jgi:hypothetical protein
VSDVFEEAEENLRQKKWMEIAKTYGPWVGAGLAACLALALGAWGFQTFSLSQTHKASEAYQRGLDALQTGNKEVAQKEFLTVTKSMNANYKALAYMQLSGYALDTNKTNEAVKSLEQAVKNAKDPALKDLALLKLAYLKMDKSSYKDVEVILKPLTNKDRPLTFLAREALATLKLQHGDSKGARAEFSALSLTLGAPEGIKALAQSRVAAIDSGSDQVAREALKLPEPEAVAEQGIPGLEGLPGIMPQ